MAERNSLKEYYVNIMKLYNNAVNILTAINQSMVSSSSEVTVTVADTDDATTTVRLPSFLYLENKVEQLDNKLTNLFNIPESGEAWFDNTSNMSKLNLIRSNTAPITPTFDNTLKAYSIDNSILKDMVCPKVHLKVNVTNLTNNIDKMYMKKIVFLNADLYSSIKSMNISSYDDYKSALYNFTKGVEYEEYDSVLNLPIRTDLYISQFNINSVEETYTDKTSAKICYKLNLNTIHYYSQEDSTIEFTLKPGDFICLGNEYVKYKVLSVDVSKNQIIIEEQYGHVALCSIENNSEMVLQIYNNGYDSFHYVQVPLEENQYIAIFLGTIFNNVRSVLSDAILVDLSSIPMCDEYGNQIKENGKNLTYLDYYNKYCKNVGDLVSSLAEVTYPQIGNCTSEQLQELQNGIAIRQLVTESISNNGILKVVPINKHLIDDVATQDIINLHAQKNEIDAQLLTLTDNISQVYSTLINTDFSQEVYITQEQLQSQLQQYYTQRTTLTKQFDSLVDAINEKNADNTLANANTKYRIRGVSNIDALEKYIHDTISDKYQIDLIGLEVEYKYKSTTKDTTSVTVIDKSTFSDWNRLNNIDRQRHLVFDALGAVSIDFTKYDTSDNIIKWNQIDIPIRQGEDVIVRVRYKFNVGQPFINVYSPWSDEITVVFPSEYEDNVELTSILKDNKDDTVSAKFSEKLINDGYQEHINNSLTVNSQKFYHMPENIYSGFNTSENNMLSLKDKLNMIDKDLTDYKTAIDRESNSKYEVYVTIDKSNIKMSSSATNSIDIYNTNHINDTFIKKNLNIVIKNTGEIPLRLYSIFPGQTDVPLLISDIKWYNEEIGNYERVPLFVNDKIRPQVLGQCIYFRQYNPYTGKSLYYHSDKQDDSDTSILSDKNNSKNKKLTFNADPKDYMAKDNTQLTLGYRNRVAKTTAGTTGYITWGFFDTSNNIESALKLDNIITYSNINDISNFYYINNEKDKYTTNYYNRYEDIYGLSKNARPNNDNTYDASYYTQLDNETSLSQFLSNNTNEYFNDTDSFRGAFLYVNLESIDNILTDGGEKDYIEIGVGKSLTIPVVFECYMPISYSNIKKSDNMKQKTYIERTLMFDIRESLVRNPDHYIIKFVGHSDNTLTGQTYSDIPNLTSLEDAITNNINEN